MQLGRGYLKREQGEAMLDAFQKAQSLVIRGPMVLAVVYHKVMNVEADLHRAEVLYSSSGGVKGPRSCTLV